MNKVLTESLLKKSGRAVSAYEKRSSFMRILILAQITYMFLFYGVFASFSLLSKVRYLTDIVTLILAVGLIADRRKLYRISGKAYYIPLLVYTIICIATAVVNKTEPLLFIWAVRNTFRFFIFFFACIIYVRKEDITKFCDFLLKLQLINFPLLLIEYFYFRQFPKKEIGILADRVSGIFGSEIGGNGCLNIYLCLVLIIVLINFFENGKIKPIHILSLANVTVCAAFSELKVFYLEAVAIYIICSIFYCRRIAKNPVQFIKLTVLCVFFLIAGFLLIFGIYPYTRKDFSDLGRYERGTMLEYRLGRVKAFSNINELFFNDSIIKNLFGLGFGNCEYSSFSFLVSDFYKSYGDYNYRWFSHQMLYLETGAVGFVTFASFFVTMAIQSLVMFHKQPENRKIAVFSIAVAAVLFVTLWYNNMARSDFGYVCYFCLAFAPILINSNNEIDSNETLNCER